jgi:hypothetical protein
MGILSVPSQRQRYLHLGSASSAATDCERGFSVGVEACYTLARDGEAYAAGVLERPTGGKSDAVVEHTNVESIAGALCGDDHGSA